MECNSPERQLLTALPAFINSIGCKNTSPRSIPHWVSPGAYSDPLSRWQQKLLLGQFARLYVIDMHGALILVHGGMHLDLLAHVRLDHFRIVNRRGRAPGRR